MNLKNYLSIDKLNKSNFKKIFFYRICGTGMGAAACLLKQAGFEVEGADSMFYPPMTNYLESSGIKYFKLSEINIQEKLRDFDLIVVGNVVAGTSTEAREIEELGIPFCSFPAAIGVGLFTGIVGAVILNTEWFQVDTAMPQSTLSTLGNMLLNEYVLIFELLGILLLVALIGAASMARK